MLSHRVSLLKLMLNSCLTIDIYEREPSRGDFIKYTFNMELHLDAYKLNSFKLGVILDMTMLYYFRCQYSSPVPDTRNLIFTRPRWRFRHGPVETASSKSEY